MLQKERVMITLVHHRVDMDHLEGTSFNLYVGLNPLSRGGGEGGGGGSCQRRPASTPSDSIPPYSRGSPRGQLKNSQVIRVVVLVEVVVVNVVVVVTCLKKS